MNGAGGKALRVVELSSGIAGAYCGWLLQQMGAEVALLEAAQTGIGPDLDLVHGRPGRRS